MWLHLQTIALGHPLRCADTTTHSSGRIVFFGGIISNHGLFLTGKESPREAQVAMLRHCVAMLPGGVTGRVLDGGCGYGGTSLFLAREFGCRVHGISVSPRQVAYARLNARKSGLSTVATFAVADAEKLEFSSSLYDLLWIMEAADHFVDRPRFFQWAANMLRHGGALLIAAWVAGDHVKLEALEQVARASICPIFSSVQEYGVMMTNAGLRILKSEDLTECVMKTWQIVSCRVHRLKWLIPFASMPVREFSRNIELIHQAFRSRMLTYRLWVAARISG